MIMRQEVAASDSRKKGATLMRRGTDKIARQVEICSPNFMVCHLRNLRFPIAVRIYVAAGTCEVSLRGFARTLCAGDGRTIPALEPISLILLQPVALVLTLGLGDCIQCAANAAGTWQEGAELLGDDEMRRRKPVASALSSAVFSAPHANWQLSSASAMLKQRTGMHLARKLLQEGESFREVVRTQRHSRILLDLLGSSLATWPGAYGYRDRCQLENAVYDYFDMPLAALLSLSNQPVQRIA